MHSSHFDRVTLAVAIGGPIELFSTHKYLQTIQPKKRGVDRKVCKRCISDFLRDSVPSVLLFKSNESLIILACAAFDADLLSHTEKMTFTEVPFLKK